MKKLDLEIAVWKEGKYYVAQCLNIEVSSFGKNKKEAIKNINEALDLYFYDAPSFVPAPPRFPCGLSVEKNQTPPRF